jgi:hypothetical protein
MRVTERRRKLEFADMMRYLLDDLYPEVERIRLVVDNLNTHSPAAFYESFSAQEARRMSKERGARSETAWAQASSDASALKMPASSLTED